MPDEKELTHDLLRMALNNKCWLAWSASGLLVAGVAGGAAVKALSLTQPWATLVAMGAKRIETRSWATSYRGRDKRC